MSGTEQSASKAPPPRPEKLLVEYFESPESVSIICLARRSNRSYIFLTLWLIGWTVGCVFLFVEVANKPSIGSLVFAVPFWVSWLFVAGLIIQSVFGTETFVINEFGADYCWSTLINLSSKRIPLAEIRVFCQCQSSYQENDCYLYGIEMVSSGKPVRFAFRLPEREREWLIYQLNRFLSQLHARNNPNASMQSNSEPWLVQKIEAASVTEVMTKDAEISPPRDLRWGMTDDFDNFVFHRWGEWHWMTFLAVLFVVLFWDGMVMVFILLLMDAVASGVPVGWEWWGLFIFLIPFEAIGLAMLAALFFVIIEPFRQIEWVFEPDQIIRRWRYPGVKISKNWPVPPLCRLELRRVNRQAINIRDVSDEAPFELAFVTVQNVDLCHITDLTEGEARWMARSIFEKRPAWF